jgi:hypothetical protein
MDGSTTRTDAELAGPAARLSPLTRTKLLFVLAAGLSFAASVAFWFGGDRERGLFVGLWVPSILCAANLLLVGEERRR